MESPRESAKLKRRGFTRRRFLKWSLVGAPIAVVGEAALVEPNWIKVRTVRLAQGKPSHRIVHFTDVHHKGDRKFFEAAVQKINAQSPDLVCFTGDLIEEAEHLAESLELLQQIKAPLYGVPGNHDYWAKVNFREIATAFEKSGGRWLMDESVSVAADQINLVGFSCEKPAELRPSTTQRNVVLFHYPQWVDKLAGWKFDLALAGHSHGGQVRIPFYGPLVVPWGVAQYDLGLFRTASGPLYVGAGLGWFYLNLRFNCRPEITVIEI